MDQSLLAADAVKQLLAFDDVGPCTEPDYPIPDPYFLFLPRSLNILSTRRSC
jgi:hypothetical protein